VARCSCGVWLLRLPKADSESAYLSTLRLQDDEGGSATCLAVQFFDDEELVLLLDSATKDGLQRYLVTVEYRSLDMITVPRPQDLSLLPKQTLYVCF
jgi:hypothetical protein